VWDNGVFSYPMYQKQIDDFSHLKSSIGLSTIHTFLLVRIGLFPILLVAPTGVMCLRGLVSCVVRTNAIYLACVPYMILVDSLPCGC